MAKVSNTEISKTRWEEYRVPPRGTLSRIASKFLKPFNALFDWLYHSEYNPFYRSGTLAIGLLFVLLGTGFYLLFFYSVSQPYESITRIQEQAWLGRWIRALHRYATDATLIAVVFHILQLLAQGKTWGPRTLAWISGVILLGALIVSTVTGYVMVWDAHGQYVAIAGLKLIDVLPILGDEVGLAFSGKSPLPASFFFMNLFLHVAIPLLMVFGMWVHTARLARTVWFPTKPIFYGALIGLTVLALIVPAPLIEKADLTQQTGRIPVDLWYGFWIPLQDTFGPGTIFVGFSLLALIGFSIPFWWKPPAKIQPPTSIVDEDTCTGCTQCARDCPYEAITMVPHTSGKQLFAKVSPIHCVSCGICSASCDVMAIGPEGRNASDQIAAVQSFIDRLPEDADQDAVVLVACRHNESAPEKMQAFAGQDSSLAYFDLNCCATMHSDTVELLLSRFQGIFLSGCAARNCMNRDGLDLLKGRLYEKRVPFVAKHIDRNRFKIAPHSEFEHKQLEAEVKTFQSSIASKNDSASTANPTPSLSWVFKRFIATAILLGLVAGGSQFTVGETPTDGFVRIVGVLPSTAKLACRELTEEEKQNTPLHMQRKEICEKELITYRVELLVEGASRFQTTKSPRSTKGDKATIFNEIIPISPSTYQSIQILVDKMNQTEVGENAINQSKENIIIEPGRMLIVDLNDTTVR